MWKHNFLKYFKRKVLVGKIATTLVNLRVEDVNDNRPILNPIIYPLRVNIHNFEKNLPLIRILATDRDLAPNFGIINYSILEPTSRYIENFRIDPKNGSLFMSNDLRQIKNLPTLLELHVKAEDRAGLESVNPVIFKGKLRIFKFTYFRRSLK